MTNDQMRELDHMIQDKLKEMGVPMPAAVDVLANLAAFYAVAMELHISGKTGDPSSRAALVGQIATCYDHYAANLTPTMPEGTLLN